MQTCKYDGKKGAHDNGVRRIKLRENQVQVNRDFQGLYVRINRDNPPLIWSVRIFTYLQRPVLMLKIVNKLHRRQFS